MRRSALVLLAACRIHFDPQGAPSDATDSGGDDASDALMDDVGVDALVTPVVQTVKSDTTNTLPVTIDSADGLAPVTPGNMVLVVCGALSAPSACDPTSIPTATWQQIDPGTTLGVYVACGAPAITSITVQNGAPDMNAVVVEFSGVIGGTTCVDTKHISEPCPTAPTAWTSQPTLMATTQNRELIVAVGMAGIMNAGWTVDAPYVEAIDATGTTADSNVLVAYDEVDQTPMAYTATGTIAQWNVACFTDVFAFKRL